MRSDQLSGTENEPLLPALLRALLNNHGYEFFRYGLANAFEELFIRFATQTLDVIRLPLIHTRLQNRSVSLHRPVNRQHFNRRRKR